MKTFALIVAAAMGVVVCLAEPHHHTVSSAMIKNKLRAGSASEAFEEFMTTYSKKYESADEKTHRFKSFKQNVAYLNAHNADGANTYSVGINKFSDMTPDEFKKYYLGYKERKNSFPRSEATWLKDVNTDDLPDEINWVEKKCVTPVKDQGVCRSCWSFSATGSLEGQYCAASGKLVSLSEQELVDCSFREGNEGCNGGLMDDAFQFVIDNKGLCSEKDYPYAGKNASCKASSCKSVVQIEKFVDVPKMEPKSLMLGLVQHGPISVAIHASHALQHYKGGVIQGDCKGHLNHGVLVVGYGLDKKSNEKYWLVKNSWGLGWGENGYFRMLRKDDDKEGECGILLDPSFPVVNKSELEADADAVAYQAFKDFAIEYKKRYASEEEKMHRFEIFQDNLARITAHNANTNTTFTLGINQFTDMTKEEFKNMHGGGLNLRNQ